MEERHKYLHLLLTDTRENQLPSGKLVGKFLSPNNSSYIKCLYNDMD